MSIWCDSIIHSGAGWFCHWWTSAGKKKRTQGCANSCCLFLFVDASACAITFWSFKCFKVFKQATHNPKDDEYGKKKGNYNFI